MLQQYISVCKCFLCLFGPSECTLGFSGVKLLGCGFSATNCSYCTFRWPFIYSNFVVIGQKSTGIVYVQTYCDRALHFVLCWREWHSPSWIYCVLFLSVHQIWYLRILKVYLCVILLSLLIAANTTL